jgi:hypothetical protein
VAWTLEISLQIDVTGREVRLRLTGRAGEGVLDLPLLRNDAEALASSASGRLDGERKTVLGNELLHLVDRRHGFPRPGDGRHPRIHRRAPGGGLVAHALDHLGLGPNPHESCVDDRTREVGVLGQEPVAGVDGIGARAGGCIEDRRHLQVGLRGWTGPDVVGLAREARVQRIGIEVRVHGHRLDVEVVTGPHHTNRDLAAVGHEQLGEHGFVS